MDGAKRIGHRARKHGEGAHAVQAPSRRNERRAATTNRGREEDAVSLLFPLFGLALLLGCAKGDESSAAKEASDSGVATETGTDTATSVDAANDEHDAATDATAEVATDPCAPGGKAPVLACADACAKALFDGAPFVDEFDDATSFAANWKTSWVAPTLQAGSLVFGPHPLTANWWENYSPAMTVATYGDALYCARLRVSPTLADDGSGGDTLELITRTPAMGAKYETSGMVLMIDGGKNTAYLHTRLDDGTFLTHDTQPLSFAGSDEQTVDALVYGKGDAFVAEVKIGKSVVVLRAKYASIGSSGLYGLLGWRNHKPWYVDRAIIGAPATDVAARLASELP